VRQASRQVVAAIAIEKLGKQERDENGKHLVNEDNEESFAHTEISRAHARMNWPTRL
jgi:hypothetical protein